MKPAAPLFLLAGVLLLAGLFWWFKPAPATPELAPAAPVPVATSAPAVSDAPPEPLPTRFSIAKGALVGNPQALRVAQGSAVRLELLSDVAAELHVHGYDHELPVPPNTPARLDFIADKAGRFELEAHLHGGHIELGVIEVMPR